MIALLVILSLLFRFFSRLTMCISKRRHWVQSWNYVIYAGKFIFGLKRLRNEWLRYY